MNGNNKGNRDGENEKREFDRCGTMEVHERLLRTYPEYARNLERLEDFTRRYVERSAKEGARIGVIIIPVVVHVVWRTAPENITDAQIQSQIDVLNADFRALNADLGSTPAVFQPAIGDLRIQFQLALRDPNCNSTNGITRTQTTVTTFNSDTDDAKSAATGGADPWPSDRYLNIWVVETVVNTLGQDLLGYAQFPGGPAATDGVVIKRRAFGTTGPGLLSQYDQGRTATHEIGHWLNLRHIWGTSGCANDDGVADTPVQNNFHTSCPAFPQISCSNGPNGDMFMNYMDYVDDACMFMFTAGQGDRANAAITGARASIIGSDGLLPPPPAPLEDLWMQDKPEDIGDEPDIQASVMWESDDIWVRTTNNGIAIQDHEIPIYRPAGMGSNFVYCRIRNRGCSDADSATVRLYWAKASTGLSWPAPWDGSVIAPALMGGLIGSQSTGSVASGSYTILEFPWYPPNPADYASFGADRTHFCLLARIETASSAPFGMTFPESSNLDQNVRNNNNIVWKNIGIMEPAPGGGRVGYVMISNFTKETSLANLALIVPRGIPEQSLFDFGTLILDLTPELYERWRDGGSKSDVVEPMGKFSFVMLKPGAWIGNIKLAPGDVYTVRLQVRPHEQVSPRTAIYAADLVQYEIDDHGGEHPGRVVGGQRFVVKTRRRR